MTRTAVIDFETTGITNAMVRSAPGVDAVMAQAAAHAHGKPVIGYLPGTSRLIARPGTLDRV